MVAEHRLVLAKTRLEGERLKTKGISSLWTADLSGGLYVGCENHCV